MRILLAGGGTGGHVIPALAVAEELRASGHEAAFMGTARGMEARLVPEAGFPLHLVHIGQLNRVSLATRLRTLLGLPLAVFSAMRILRSFRAQVVIGVGGYAAGPATIAAVLLRIPIILFEPNVVPGYANRVVARFSVNAAVHFQQTGKWFRRYEVTGVPVRPSFYSLPARRSAPPTLLVFGGSQGARALNNLMIEAAPKLLERVPGLHIVHQTGAQAFTALQSAMAATAPAVEVCAFISDMAQAFSDADLVVCRSGASTVAEIAAAGKCALFVPFPGAADDHQLRNAELLASQNAALLLPENELTAEKFVDQVAALFNNPARMAEMSQRAHALAHPGAAARIAQMAIEAAKKQ